MSPHNKCFWREIRDTHSLLSGAMQQVFFFLRECVCVCVGGHYGQYHYFLISHKNINCAAYLNHLIEMILMHSSR